MVFSSTNSDYPGETEGIMALVWFSVKDFKTNLDSKVCFKIVYSFLFRVKKAQPHQSLRILSAFFSRLTSIAT